MSQESLDLLTDLLSSAKRAGADAADAVLVRGTSLSHGQRLGKLEGVERSEGQELGLRAFVGKRQAIVSTSDFSKATLSEIVERAIAMARTVPEDPFCGLAAPDEVARSLPDIDMLDAREPEPNELRQRAERAEAAARAIAGVTNSEGASASWSRHEVALAATNGFARSYAGSASTIAVSVIAGSGTDMESEYDSSTAVYAADLKSPEDVGKRAGERAVARLGARKSATTKAPVVLDPRMASGLLRTFAGAIAGPAIARKSSFLREQMGKQVFDAAITIVDDPHRPRGMRSKPFDGEGVATAKRTIVEGGRLTTWLLDGRSARQLGLVSTGHAARGASSLPAPAPTNLSIAKGSQSPAELMAPIANGFYVTQMMGQGINMVTGDYSRGASGFWIENGKLAYPVSEVTIAGNLAQMFAGLAAADDLVFQYGIDAPTLRIAEMTIAGL